MRVIAKRTLREFWEQHSDAEQPLKAWHREAKEARWETSSDIKQRYSSASFVSRNRVVFNIGGNKYRLIVAVKYAASNYDGIVFIKFIGTHREYDGVDATTV